MENIDTHFYDGKIGPIYKDLCKIDDNELDNNLNFNDCLNEIMTSLDKYRDNEIDKNILKNVLFLLQNDKDNNYDSENDIHVDDILVRTWRFIKYYEKDAMLIFLEQLGDIYYGPCPQGRVTRLFQFYEYHINNKDRIYNMYKKISN